MEIRRKSDVGKLTPQNEERTTLANMVLLPLSKWCCYPSLSILKGKGLGDGFEKRGGWG
jgi:hypothetical protein